MDAHDAMPDINRIIATNLKNLRKAQGLSLGEAAERTGVSKSMLGQIERGESSPTVSTLWKIATGLDISFTALMEQEEEGIRIIHEKDMTPIISDNGLFRLYPVVQAHPDRSFELLDLILDPGAVSKSRPHTGGTEEFVLVYQGALEIELGEDEPESYVVPTGSVVHYRADRPHTYRNASDLVTRAAMVINYPREP